WMLGEPEAAEDITQDTFLLAYRNLPSFRGGSFKAWLFRIVSNLCYDELRRKNRRPTQPLNPTDSEDDEIESPAWLADSGPTPEELVERADLRQTLQRFLEELPAEYRSLVLLVDVEGLNYMEAAQALDIPVGTVKSRLARARMRLRGWLLSSNEWSLPEQACLECG
ncbi:MAG TPA: sigma-70 family RNA polymerase sigma factor, partial [Anaerolineales bacterium]